MRPDPFGHLPPGGAGSRGLFPGSHGSLLWIIPPGEVLGTPCQRGRRAGSDPVRTGTPKPKPGRKSPERLPMLLLRPSVPRMGLPIPTASGLASRLPPFTQPAPGSRELSRDEFPENYLGTAFSRHPPPETRAARRRGTGNGSGGSPGRGTDGGRTTPGVPPRGCSWLAGNPLRRSAPCLKLRGES